MECTGLFVTGISSSSSSISFVCDMWIRTASAFGCHMEYKCMYTFPVLTVCVVYGVFNT